VKTNAIAAAKETLPAIKTEAMGLINKLDSGQRKRKGKSTPKSINKHRKTDGTIFHKK
jgi:hypothetical protein